MIDTLLQRLGLKEAGFAGGVVLPHLKPTEHVPIEQAPLPTELVVPLKQHIGQQAEPLLAVGDRVLRGQKIARAQGYVSASVHAPTSGRITHIGERPVPHPSGLGLPAIVIEADGEDRADESLAPMPDYCQIEPALLRERVRLSGIVGLGGAVFPSYIKLGRDPAHRVETVILNGVECESLLTNDHRLMLEEADAVVRGLDIVLHMVGCNRAIIAVEDNKPDAAAALTAAVASHPNHAAMTVRMVPTRYPQGGEKQLIQTLTGREVPAGKLPLHIGLLCHNVATAKAVHDAVLFGMPLTERVVTLSGPAMVNPGNLRVRLGTSMRWLLQQRGIESPEALRLLHGGPMMGELLPNLDVPFVKGSTGLLAFGADDFLRLHAEEQPCIRCGHCGEACPARLVPNELMQASRHHQFDLAQQLNLFDCIECGCCSYVCPARIPLVHYFRFAKGEVAHLRREGEFALLTKQRSDAREARLAREAAEKAAKREKMRSGEGENA